MSANTDDRPLNSQQPAQPGQVMSVTPPPETITADEAGTLAGLFRERVKRTPQAVAYRYYDRERATWKDSTWQEMANEVARWQSAIRSQGCKRGDRIAIMAHNSREWVMLDQAVLGLGMVVVPLYTEDRAENVEYILQDAGVVLLVIENQTIWDRMREKTGKFKTVKRIVSLRPVPAGDDPRLVYLNDWLPVKAGKPGQDDCQPGELATIVYTSGTTGRPKGVMLSHRNILSNAWSCVCSVVVPQTELFLSFLPLSHTLERTVGYYLPMMSGATVAFARSIETLAEDMVTVKPTALICVPRIFERIYARVKEQLQYKPDYLTRLFGLAIDVGWYRYEYSQGRGSLRPSFVLWPLLKWLVADKVVARFGGRLSVAISGGAALSPRVAKTFIGLGVPILQGYGLTEASPVVSVNRVESNIPESIGPPLPGVEVKIGEYDELLVRGDLVMLGYWQQPDASREVITEDGWLHTGDKAMIENNRHIYITGRLKDIIVMANGEKISPSDMELAIATDTLFEQIMVIGESRPFLTAITVLNESQWNGFLEKCDINPDSLSDEEREEILLERIAKRLEAFPGYADIKHVAVFDEKWSIENNLLTPTLKPRRHLIKEKYSTEIDRMYEGHLYDK